MSNECEVNDIPMESKTCTIFCVILTYANDALRDLTEQNIISKTESRIAEVVLSCVQLIVDKLCADDKGRVGILPGT